MGGTCVIACEHSVKDEEYFIYHAWTNTFRRPVMMQDDAQARQLLSFLSQRIPVASDP